MIVESKRPKIEVYSFRMCPTKNFSCHISTLVVLAIAGIALGGILAVAYMQIEIETYFTLYLRCNDNNQGMLSVAQETKTGTFQNIQQVDLSTACKSKKIKLFGYQPERRLRFTLQNTHVNKAKAIAEYGSDIQRDEEGFYAVLKIADSPPYLTNDQI
ncbi:MAG: hypothetical protein P8179_08160 [Candidatus Thiodiazotropha sp.]|jgi:hypothetical protein